jgi:nitrite reductase (NO-forming)
MEKITNAKMDRRSLLKRAGILGLTIPTAGALLSACGGSDKDVTAAEMEKGTEGKTASTNGAPAAAATGATTEITIMAMDLKFEPNQVSVPANSPVRVTFMNHGAMEHDWEVQGLGLQDLQVVTPAKMMSDRANGLLDEAKKNGAAYAAAGSGDEMVVEFTPTKGGTFEMMCMVPGHAAAGMKGTFTVTGGDATQAAAPAHDANSHGLPTPDGGGTPYAADRLPNPTVAAPIGKREATTIKQEISIKEVVGYVDEGVAYEFWTFDGTIPGTMIRARVGDHIELTLHNPAENKMAHNIDLHAVTGPGGGAHATTIGPGQSATFRWKARHQGVYVYHCAVAPIPHHISSGMYGLVIIEPEDGYAPVDREFYLMQGDLYLEGARGEKGLRPFSMDKMLDERPDYVTFNGAVGALTGDRAMKANVGETARIFFGVGGPNLTSSFHVIGEILEVCYQEGASEPSTNVQTTLVPAGGAMMAELTFEVPGTYTIVDHSLGRAGKGAIAEIVVEGPEDPDVFEVISQPS